jgi:hypothetical protein
MKKTIVLTGDYETKDVILNGHLLTPERSQQVYNHSPDGFNWGYGGSGPAQLALAILLELYPQDVALRNYQQFKADHIAALPNGTGFYKLVMEVNYE